MPLSKDRDAERKRNQRAATKLHKQLGERIQKGTMGDVLTPYRSISAVSRLDKQFSPPAGPKPVQPTALEEEALDPINNPSLFLTPEIDADGNVIPDYG